MPLPTNAQIDAACPPSGSTRPRSDLTNTVLKDIVANVPGGGGGSGTSRDSSSPKDYAADPTGSADATSAVIAVINDMNANGKAGCFDGGTWRVTSALPIITRPIIVGDGSGTILVDYNPANDAVILDLQPPLGEVYTVTAVAQGVTFDFNGTFTGDSLVTRLTLSLGGGQVMPVTGSVGKLSATNILAAAGGTDQTGQHVYIIGVSGNDIFIPWTLFDTFSTGMQLTMLGANNPCSVAGLMIRHASYANVIANDLRMIFMRALGAIQPTFDRLRFRDGGNVGLMLAGTYLASTRNLRFRRMRNATVSETPAVTGCGVLECGTWQSNHQDLGGSDCRHVFTTASLSPSWPRVSWGRSFRPMVGNGQAAGCSAAAYDTHQDCVGAEFQNLAVAGGYLGEDSAGVGIQIRGIGCRVRGCAVADLPVGLQVKKTYAGEIMNHEIEDFRYEGSGVPIRSIFEPGLATVDQRQKLRLGNCHLRTTNQQGVGLSATDLEITGRVLVENFGAAVANDHALHLADISTAKSCGGKLVHDFSTVTGAPNPRVIQSIGNGNAILGLDVQVIAGSVVWRGVVCEGEATPASFGDLSVTCDADAPPSSASGGFSTNGASNLLPAGALRLMGTINGARSGAARTASFALTAFNNRQRLHCTSPITITIPAANILGTDFECFIAADGASVVLDGSGATNVTLTAGQVARVLARNSIVYVTINTATVIS